MPEHERVCEQAHGTRSRVGSLYPGHFELHSQITNTVEVVK
jgi:hypothetical protein